MVEEYIFESFRVWEKAGCGGEVGKGYGGEVGGRGCWRFGYFRCFVCICFRKYFRVYL